MQLSGFYQKCIFCISINFYEEEPFMNSFRAFLKRKNIEISVKRYLIDALGAMAQGLFCSLLIGTIINAIGTLFHVGILTQTVATIAGTDYTVGGLATAMSGPAMAVAIGRALQSPPLVLFSLVSVGFATNALGGAGGPLAVLFVAIVTAEIGKMVAGETKIDILVTPLVTIGVGIALAAWWAPPLGALSLKVGNLIMWATELQPLLMGIIVSVVVGIALTLPISSAAICAALNLTGLAGGAAVAGCCAQMIGFAVQSFKENGVGGLVSQGAAVSSGMGTCGLVGQIGVFTGWVNDVAAGKMQAITAFDWFGLILISFILPAILAPLINLLCMKLGWVKPGDQKLPDTTK
jgi:uncharacterized membrane protein